MIQSTFIFAGNQERPSSHCASITELPGGELFAVWYAGTNEGHPDVAIVASRLLPGAQEWSAPEVLVDPPGKPGGNPVVWYDDAGVLHHFYNIIEDPQRGWQSALLYWDRSDDGGHTWRGAELFDEQEGTMVRHRPVRLRSGRVILPAYDECRWQGLCFISDDNGASWRRGGRIARGYGGFLSAVGARHRFSLPCMARNGFRSLVHGMRCIQPAIIERSDGTLHALLRPRVRGCAYESDSRDAGEHWTACMPSALRNPNSGADMIRLRSGEVVVCFNDSVEKRTPLTLAVSLDEGRTWAARWNLETGEGQFCYPTLMQASDETVHLVYTWKREGIKHVRISPQWLRELAHGSACGEGRGDSILPTSAVEAAREE